jgi:hypothetical protein
MKIRESDIHNHLKIRMLQRGITFEEIKRTINDGWNAKEVRIGTQGKTLVFPYHAEWEGKRYKEKEVTVYYKIKDGKIILLTAVARYGKDFNKGGKTNEN